MPITSFKDYSVIYPPSCTTKEVTLLEAFQSVVQGELDTSYVFNILPKKIQNTINNMCQPTFGQNFKQLTDDEQKKVFTILLLALQT